MLRLGAVLAVSYLLIVLLMWPFQERLLYLPGGWQHVATPADIGLEWRAVELTTEDSLGLDAWWVPAENPRRSLLFLHGNAGNISHRLDSLELFNGLGLSVLILDYRGRITGTGTLKLRTETDTDWKADSEQLH